MSFFRYFLSILVNLEIQNDRCSNDGVIHQLILRTSTQFCTCNLPTQFYCLSFNVLGDLKGVYNLNGQFNRNDRSINFYF